MPGVRSALETIVPLLQAVLLFTQGSAAQTRPMTLTTLHKFAGSPDGATPLGGVAIGSGGVLYGTTYGGGTAGGGTVFSLTPQPGGAWTEAVLSLGYAHAIQPRTGVTVGDGGVLYGTSYFNSSVFAVQPPTMPGGQWMENVIGGSSDVVKPRGALAIGSGGVLYGTSEHGGYQGLGAVFSVTPPAVPGGTWTTTLIYSANLLNDIGTHPKSGVAIGSGGVLYGTTTTVGQIRSGTVYALTPPPTPGGAWSAGLVHLFESLAEGFDPGVAGVVIGTNGAMYGTTTAGGTGTACMQGCGTVYMLAPSFAVLYSFQGGSDGVSPNGVVIGPGGVLYGTTSAGGTGGLGTVFSLTPPSSTGGPWTETVLHSFTGSDGANPAAGVVISGLALYGTTSGGGSGTCGCGTVFQLR